MIGSPYQTPECLLRDIRFLQQLCPDMIGVGPYLTHPDTPFAGMPSGDLKRGLRILSMLRLLFPKALIPATTAFGTVAPDGRELALKAGANVVMPNLSPVRVRKLYSLYENKICTGEEAAECRGCLERRPGIRRSHLSAIRPAVRRAQSETGREALPVSGNRSCICGRAPISQKGGFEYDNL